MKRIVTICLLATVILVTSLFQSSTWRETPLLVAGSEPLTEPIPYMEYQLYDGTIVVDNEPLPVLPGGMGDYAALFDKYDLCNLVVSGEIDEIWIWAGNGDGATLGNLAEWTTTGPGWSGLTPDCGEVVTTMVFNYTREVGSALHSYGHRMEGLMRHYRPCDFSTANWPWNALDDTSGDFANCGSLLSDSYGYVARPFPGNSYVGGCGDVHFPPNISQQDNREYIYNELTLANSLCPDWSQDGSASITQLNCQIWGCTEYGYQIWWMQNLPGLNNINRDRNGDYHPNWWDYLFDVAYAPTPTPAATPTPTATVASTPTMAPTATPRPTGTPTITPTPISPPAGLDEHNFLPVVKSPPLNANTLVNVHIATKPIPGRPELTFIQPNMMIESTTATAAEAVVKPVVFVINLTAYAVNGPPLDGVSTMNAQLIAGLKEATIYHGYIYNPYLQATFLGQDGAGFAGAGCTTGTAPDNAHIQLTGLRMDVTAVSYRVQDDSGGAWANPCDPVSNWLLHVESGTPGTADVYFKPFRVAPDGTIYIVTVTYADGSVQTTSLVGTKIAP